MIEDTNTAPAADATSLPDTDGRSVRDEIIAAMSATSDGAPKDSSSSAPAPKEDKPASAPQEKARDEQGRFAKAATQAEAPPAADAAKAVDAAPAAPNEDAQRAPAVAPPRGWSIQAKAAFDTLPDHVKEAIAKREAEVDAGFSKYRGLDRHVQSFSKAGVDLSEAIDRYQAAEQDLANDPVGGFARLAQVMGIDHIQLAQHWLGQAGVEQNNASQDGQAIPLAVQNHIRNLEQRLSSFESQFNGERQSKAMNEVEAFLADPANKYADNVLPHMERLIIAARNGGQQMSLSEAYEAATWANPEVRALLIQDRLNASQAEQTKAAAAAAQKAKQASLSVTGSPTPGVSTSGASNRSVREELEEAFALSRGRA